jgi:hypothetical protein
MTPQPRAARPADAQAVWDSMVKAGGTPTFGNVAQALNASGQFAPVNKMSVKRWHDRGWAEAKTGVRKPALEQTAAAVDAAVPVLNGKATTRAKDIVGKPFPSANANDSAPAAADDSDEDSDETDQEAQELREELEGKSDDALIKAANREAYITAIILLRQIQKRPKLVGTMPREIGSLQNALAGSIVAANGGFKVLLEMQDKLLDLVPDPPQDGAPEPPPDPLAAAIDAFRKAEDEHG